MRSNRTAQKHPGSLVGVSRLRQAKRRLNAKRQSSTGNQTDSFYPTNKICNPNHTMPETDVDKFLAQTEAIENTKLERWESQIFELLAKKASYETIRKYLKIQGLKAERSNIAKFVKAKKRAKLYAKAMEQRNSGLPNPIDSSKPPQKFSSESSQNAPSTTSTDPPAQPPHNLITQRNNPSEFPNALPEFTWDPKNKPPVDW